MKNLKTSIAVLLILIFAASCRKTDQLTQQKVASEENVPVASLPEGVTQSTWQQAADWNKVEQPAYSVFFSNIKGDISAENAEQGLIRVFKVEQTANATVPKALPFEETAGDQKFYWYYQVTEGNVMIAVDVYGGGINPADKSLFKFVIVGKDAVSDFENKGMSKANLMDMSYDMITAQ